MYDSKHKKEKCIICGKEYRVIWETYPTKMDDRRETYYTCPYCNNIVNVYCNGNEEVRTEKL